MFEILAHRVILLLADFGMIFQNDIGFALFVIEKPPTGIFEEFVDLYPGFCFFIRHRAAMDVQPIKVKLIFEFMAYMFLHFHNIGFAPE